MDSTKHFAELLLNKPEEYLHTQAKEHMSNFALKMLNMQKK